MSAEETVEATIKHHTWWPAGNLGVPGMPDWTTYKCNCGWSGDKPHAHVAQAVVEALGLREEEGADFTFGGMVRYGTEWVPE